MHCMWHLAVAILCTLGLAIPTQTPSLASTPLDARDIKCLQVGAAATATWTNSLNQTCTYVGVVGSNWGANVAGNGDYSCNGRCGAGCSGFALGDAYTQACFSHDVCSYFSDATGGSRDANCGAAFDAAVDDTLFGGAAGCWQRNPTASVHQPCGKPVCK